MVLHLPLLWKKICLFILIVTEYLFLVYSLNYASKFLLTSSLSDMLVETGSVQKYFQKKINNWV